MIPDGAQTPAEDSTPSTTKRIPPLSPTPPPDPTSPTNPQPSNHADADPIVATRVLPEFKLQAIARLIPDQSESARGVQRFIATAKEQNICLDELFATFDQSTNPPEIGQVCLAVAGAGATATLFISTRDEDSSSSAQQRIAAIEKACLELGKKNSPAVRLAQALLEPHEKSAIRAFLDAGFINVGELAYLCRPASITPCLVHPSHWPQGIQVRQIQNLDKGSPDYKNLLVTLERTYQQTLDCSELAGLRSTEDVIASHQASGEFAPQLWWLVFDQGQPEGCVLFNLYPTQSSAELVYLGLSPKLRGKGLSTHLLDLGLNTLLDYQKEHSSNAASPWKLKEINCAVDRRNAPAIRLYERAGFTEFASRVGLVKIIS